MVYDKIHTACRTIPYIFMDIFVNIKIRMNNNVKYKIMITFGEREGNAAGWGNGSSANIWNSFLNKIYVARMAVYDW